MDSVVINRNGSDTRCFFFGEQEGTAWNLCAKWCPTKGKYGCGEQNLQGNDKMAAKGNPKTTQQPPKLPQQPLQPYYD